MKISPAVLRFTLVVALLLVSSLLVPARGAAQQWVGSGGNPMYYNGKVGVGRSPLQFPFEVYDPGNGFIKTTGLYAGVVIESGAGNFSVIDFNNTTGPGMSWRLGMLGSDAFALVDQRNGVSRMEIDLGGNVILGGSVSVRGDVTATGSIAATYQDVAEWVPATGDVADGTVVVLDTRKTNAVRASEHAYDTTVAGVVSATPGLILGVASESKAKIATMGRVRVWVDATKAPVAAGDLLVTSDTAGQAMKSEPIEIGGHKFHQPGTIVGKALEPLASGHGQILVLLSMQ
jgi:hypothetical protein